MTEEWKEATEWERNWWGSCQNTYNEEFKQLVYARKIGIDKYIELEQPFSTEKSNITVVDIGGGPCSLLLKTPTIQGTVVDPCNYPSWIVHRYDMAGIKYIKEMAEKFMPNIVFDEVWCYNVLQHTLAPEKILFNMRKVSKIIRMFEWIETGTSNGHLHNLTEEFLNTHLGGEGRIEYLNEPKLRGLCYYGIFKGFNYEEENR